MAGRKFNGHWKQTVRKSDSKWEEKLRVGCLKSTEHQIELKDFFNL